MAFWRLVLTGVVVGLVLLAACGQGKNPAPAPAGAPASNPAPVATPALTPASTTLLTPTPVPPPTPNSTPPATPTPTATPTGTLPPAAPPAATPTPTPAPTAPAAPNPTLTPGDSLVEGKYLYSLTCGICHGPDGKGRTFGTMVSPPIVGLPKAFILARLRVLPESYFNFQMPQFRPAQLSDAEFDKIYQYIFILEQAPTLAALSVPIPPPPPGDSLAQGKYLYSLTCGTCHGADGKKRDLAFMVVPTILGKTKGYLLERARQPPPLMIPFAPTELSDADFDKIYQYILTLEEAG